MFLQMRSVISYSKTGLLLLLLLAVAISGCSRQKPKVSKLDKEPQLTVVINEQTNEKKTMGVEEYIQGVVGGEMGQIAAEGEQATSWPENAYAAQAIIARSFIMAYMKANNTNEVTINHEETQAYKPENITPQIKAAVEKTRGEVLMQGDNYIKTWFHSYSGGKTATAAEGLNYKDEENYTLSVALSDNEFVPEERKRWQVTLPLSQVQSKLAAKGVNVGQISDMQVTARGPSGRITQITITGSSGTQQIHGADFRIIVGPEEMLSTLVDQGGFQIANGNVTISGSGFGHGVGLSQWDAYKMAKEGMSPEEIVQKFYQNVELVKRWD
jgi:stage II sporulation protein D